MKVSFVVNPVFINNGWSPWDRRVGGSEECVVEWSRRLRRRGHEVSVYHNGQHGEFDGVIYRERRDYLRRGAKGVTVNVNYPDFDPHEDTVYWTSLTSQGGRSLSKFKAVCYISEYARDNTGLQHTNLIWLPPGYDPAQIYPGNKIPQSVLYASSPDRGLETLLHVWPEVVAEVPAAQLLVTYGAGATRAPNVTFLGEVSDEEMNQLYRESDIWCHPANGYELYCMTGVKAQVAQCWPVYFPIMALAETVKFGTKSTPETLVRDLVAALRHHPPQPPRLEFPTWDSTTDTLEKTLKTL